MLLDTAGEEGRGRDGDFDFAGEAPRAGGVDFAGEAARARAGDFAVFDFGGITQMACRTARRVLLVKFACYVRERHNGTKIQS